MEMKITPNELETLRMALIAYRISVVHASLTPSLSLLTDIDLLLLRIKALKEKFQVK
jgi:hypothetical protein